MGNTSHYRSTKYIDNGLEFIYGPEGDNESVPNDIFLECKLEKGRKISFFSHSYATQASVT